MSGLLSRFTTFLPNTTILSNDHNQELNRIVQLLNGTTTNLKTVLKTSDAGDPPLELDQLSTGPILKLFQGGILKAQFSNLGNLLFNQSGGFIGDQNANEYLKFATVASAVNELEISNAATGGRPKIAATGGDTNIDLELAGKGTGLVRLPASSPTADDHAARKKYVDDRTVSFIFTYKIDDPSTFPLSDNAVLPIQRIPVMTGGFITKISIIRGSGSHTSGGSVTFKPNIGGVGVIGSGISFNDTNNAANTFYTDDFTDQAISEGQALNVHVTARSGTVSERDVSIIVEGFRKLS